MTRAEKIEKAAAALLVLIGPGPAFIEADTQGTYNQRARALWDALGAADPASRPALSVFCASCKQEIGREATPPEVERGKCGDRTGYGLAFKDEGGTGREGTK